MKGKKRVVAAGIPGEQLYYGFIIVASSDAKLSVCSNTRWVGWADKDMRIELRCPRLCLLPDQLRWFGRAGIENWHIVDCEDNVFQFWLFGGACAVEEAIAKKHLSRYLEPQPVTKSGRDSFEVLTVAVQQAARRAPTPNLRMKVLKRDNYRCRICGQNPSDDTNIILHVHHIRPWSERGATDLNNLVTLCHTCHAGLHPHNELACMQTRSPSNEVDELRQGISRYSEFVRAVMTTD